MSKDKFEIGGYYHVLNRGNEKQDLFFEKENYLFFLRRLRKAIDIYGSEIICYCLMPNHFHIIMKETIENSISKTMLSLQTSYAKAINKRLNRVGHLYQDSFKYIRIARNEYLLYLSRYIHLNPIKANLVETPEDWEFSSFQEFIGIRNGSLPNPEIILSQFGGNENYRQFVLEDRDDSDIKGYTLE